MRYAWHTGDELRIVPAEFWAAAGDGGDAADAIVVPDGYPATLRFDPVAGAFVDDVDGVRARLIERIKAARDAVQAGGCGTPKGRVQTDARSRGTIDAYYSAALGAKVTGAPFEVGFTMADNSRPLHSADEMLALGAAVLTMIAGAHAAYEATRDALNAATTIGQLHAIVPED